MVNKVLISIGSNWERERNMELAVGMLKELFTTYHLSERIETEAVGEAAGSAPYLNQLIAGETSWDADLLREKLKAIEQSIGRTPADKAMKCVRIDLDLLIINETILRPKDMQQEYVTKCLPSLPIW